MIYHISAPERFNPIINLPASKSISNRALVINALANSSILPQNLSECDDTVVVAEALKNIPETIDIKAGGTAMRFLTAYLATLPGCHVITGTERMKQRPVRILVDALRRMGGNVEYMENEGFPPLRINGGGLEGGKLEIDGSVSSQFISALLMIGPTLKGGLTLTLTGDIISRPYIDLTLCTMRDFGAEAEWTDTDTIEVKQKAYSQLDYTIENDWSAASYWYEALALCGDDEAEIELNGLMDGSLQGDSVVKYLFNMLGIKTTFATKRRGVATTVKLKKIGIRSARLDYDFINQPDLAPTFVVTCAMMNIPFHFTGLASLHIKETDRIVALKREMQKLGYVVSDGNGSELIWNGERCEPDSEPCINTYDDHRMALAFAPVALALDGGIRISNPTVVTKSYPNFWDDLKHSGFGITTQ